MTQGSGAQNDTRIDPLSYEKGVDGLYWEYGSQSDGGDGAGGDVCADVGYVGGDRAVGEEPGEYRAGRGSGRDLRNGRGASPAYPGALWRGACGESCCSRRTR